MKNYFTWLVRELKSINTAGAVMLSFYLGAQTMLYLMTPITTVSTVSYLAGLVGGACTVYMMLGRPINGLLGLISAFGLIYANWQFGHYASVIEQVGFILFIDLPLMFTWKTWGKKIENGVKHLTVANWALTFGVMALAYVLSVYVLNNINGTNPLIDALALVVGTTGSFYVWRGYSASFTLWLVLDIINITLWTTAFINGGQSALFLLVIYGFYTTTAIYGRFVSVWSK